MRCLTSFARVLGICVLVLGTIAFMGCSGSGNSAAALPDNGSAGNTGGNDNSTPQASPSFVTVIPAPSFPTEQDFALAQAKPERWERRSYLVDRHDEDCGLATLSPFSINAQTGRIIKADGEKDLAVCYFGLDEVSDGATLIDSQKKGKHENVSPLGNASDFSAVRSLLPIIFPEGRNKISLSHDTELKLGVFNGNLTNPLFNTEVENVEMVFDVFNCFGDPVWTLPTCMSFTPQLGSNGKFVVNGSTLTLAWNPDKGSIPPHGQAYVVAKIKFYNNDTEILCLKKAVPIVNNTATFGCTNADARSMSLAFDEVKIELDLTCTVPFVEDHPAPPPAPVG